MTVARSGLTIQLDQSSRADALDADTKTGKALLVRAMKHLEGILSGAKQGSHAQIFANTSQPRAACATALFSSLVATDTITLGANTITCVAADAANNEFVVGASDLLSATAFCAAVNASTTAAVSGCFEASNWKGIVALAAVVAGTKIYIGAHEFTAVTGTATALPTYADRIPPGAFTIGGSNTQDGDSFALAVNNHPVLSHDLVALNAAGTVTLHQRRGTAAYAVLTKSAVSTVTLTQFVATATSCVSLLQEGLSGNQITAFAISAHGTAVSWATTALGRGNDAVPKRVLTNGSVT